MPKQVTIEIDFSIGDQVKYVKMTPYLPNPIDFGVVQMPDLSARAAVVRTERDGFLWQGSIKKFIETWEHRQEKE